MPRTRMKTKGATVASRARCRSCISQSIIKDAGTAGMALQPKQKHNIPAKFKDSKIMNKLYYLLNSFAFTSASVFELCEASTAPEHQLTLSIDMTLAL